MNVSDYDVLHLFKPLSLNYVPLSIYYDALRCFKTKYPLDFDADNCQPSFLRVYLPYVACLMLKPNLSYYVLAMTIAYGFMTCLRKYKTYYITLKLK